MSKLKFYRVEYGLTQIELAQAARVPRWRIQQDEAGIVLPDPEQMERLASALGVVPEKLWGSQTTAKTDKRGANHVL